MEEQGIETKSPPLQYFLIGLVFYGTQSDTGDTQNLLNPCILSYLLAQYKPVKYKTGLKRKML